MKILLLIVVMVAGLSEVTLATPEMPAQWKQVRMEKPDAFWKWCADDHAFYPSRVISAFRNGGSQHDGDAEYEAARLLSCVETDPKPAFDHFLSSPDPLDRVFVMWVIDILGDRRFASKLESLRGDSTDVSRWDVIGDTVGGFAEHILKRMRDGNGAQSFGDDWPVPAWLKTARMVRHAEQVGGGQPAARRESK